ncbi:Zn-ribbon domain-containing OB-fold protein [Bordetella sp. 2513F-2]
MAPQRASGLGRLYSYSVVHRAPSPAYAEDVPYTIAIVATDEGPHLMTRIVGISPERLEIGMRLRACPGRAGLPPVFEPASPEQAS